MMQPRPLRSGDFVEVRSFAEIAATLDPRGELDGLPFMPEMFPFCGRRFEVWKRADKTCDESSGGAIRRVRNVVHLKELRCGGEAHGGCDAGCLLFWKEQWLKPVASLQQTGASLSAQAKSENHVTQDWSAFVRSAIERAARPPERAEDGSELYSCQTTEIRRFSEPLRWWDFRQYFRDLRSRNVSLRQFAGGIFIGIFNKIQDLRGGRSFAAVAGVHTRTPQAALGLAPGDFVRIKSRSEIVSTLDNRGRNRGLKFRPVMIPYCGKQYRVLRQVNRIIDPRSRKMISFRESCVILDGVICAGEMRRFCPRASYTYWRDIWLNKLPGPGATPAHQPAPSHLFPAAVDLQANAGRLLRSVGRRFLSRTLVYQHTGAKTEPGPFVSIPDATWQLADTENILQLFQDDPGRRDLFLRFVHFGYLGVLLVRKQEWIAYGWVSRPHRGRPPHLPPWAEDLGAYWIFHCHTKAAFRGRGIYRGLLSHIVALAPQNGLGPVCIDTLPDNHASRSVILAAGFSPRGVATTAKLWLPGFTSIPLAGSWSPDAPHPSASFDNRSTVPAPAATLTPRY
jgi:GNAT superfamily N-acetyltransferase